ncbi:hypothetical protein NS220_06140 [Microbacterium testaceum]|uniref:Uncharacterized protein n=2 Tax=Microbacterium testaceum TaxID=2033 RepID=A0A147EYL4_MICTE|nr:hypothetical protein NS220_06140 [Microbacterium testaceum]
MTVTRGELVRLRAAIDAHLSSSPADDVREALDDLSALEAKARAATPGPWVLDGMGEDEPEVNYWAHRFIGAVDGPDIIATSEDGHGPNAEYIAAASPDVVLALIERARECAGDYPTLATHARRAVRRYDRALRRRGITIDVSSGETVTDLTDPAKAWDREFNRLNTTWEARS